MSRRTARKAQPPRLSPASPCPCGLPASYEACCGRFHRGQAAAGTAELLMRSRFSAFVAQDSAYLMRSWHPDTRPPRIDFDRGLVWLRLEVIAATDGGAFHTEGTVSFRAYYVDGGQEGVMEEQSHFVRHEGAWVYRDGIATG